MARRAGKSGWLGRGGSGSAAPNAKEVGQKRAKQRASAGVEHNGRGMRCVGWGGRHETWAQSQPAIAVGAGGRVDRRALGVV